MMQLDRDRIAEGRRLLAAATPGPWFVAEPSIANPADVRSVGHGPVCAIGGREGGENDIPAAADAELMVHMRNTHGQLLDDLEGSVDLFREWRDIALRRKQELAEARDRIAELEKQAGHRVIATAQIANEPTGTVLLSAQGDVASVDHGASGEWLGGDTRVRFLDFQSGPWEFVEFLPDGQWSVLWQPDERPMAEHLHTVTITQDEGATCPRIEFVCAGDRTAACHRYPDCDCDSWESDDDEHPHPYVEHEKCWMQDWFDNHGTDPADDTLAECDITPGMSGPIKTSFCWDYVEWEFISQPEVTDHV
ncbi:hypothetical protein [Nocardia sp. NPDC004711]